MMDDRGNVQQFDNEAYETLMRERITQFQHGLRNTITPISQDEANFFLSKGPAFRTLWGKRLSRGLTAPQRQQLDFLVNEFKKNRK